MKSLLKFKRFLTVITLFAVAGTVQAAIVPGDVISIDFGNTATAEANWNTSIISSTPDLARLSDGANTDVDLTVASTGGTPGNNNAIFADGSAQGGSSVFEIYDDGMILAGTNDDEIRLTFTGLNNALTYNLFAGGQTLGTDFGADWDISTSADGGTNQETRFQDTVSYVSFTNITSVGGTFTLTMNDISDAASPASGRNCGLSELTLTAIAPSNSVLSLGQDTLSLSLYPPDTNADGTLTAWGFAGLSSSNDVEILSLVATNGFSATVASTNLGTTNLSTDITVTYTNTGALVNHGDTTNSTLTVYWKEAGSSVTNSTNATLSVLYDVARTWSNASGDGLWNINSSTNWTGYTNVFNNGDTVSFTGTPAGTVTLAENVTVSNATFGNDTSAITLNDSGGGETMTLNGNLRHSGTQWLTINHDINGTGAIVKQGKVSGVKDGNGVLVLSGSNTFSGGVAINEGQVRITHSQALGTGTTVLQDPGANSNNDPVLLLNANNLHVTNNVTIGNNGYSKKFQFAITGSGNAEMSGTLTLQETIDRITSIAVGTDDTLTISGKVTGGGVFSSSGGSGTIKLTNEANDFTGKLSPEGGATIEVVSIANSGVASAAGAGSITLGYNTTSGTLRYTGDGDSTDRAVRIGEEYGGSLPNRAGAGTIQNNGTGALIFTRAAFNVRESDGGVAPRTMTLSGSNTNDNEIQGVIIDNYNSVAAATQVVSIVKGGVGKWILSGNNTYEGTTTINDGTLLLNGDNSGAPGAVTVNGGTLGGTGTIAGALTVTTNAILAPGAGVGSLSMKDLDMQDGSTLAIEFDSTAANAVGVDVIVVDGDLDLTGTVTLTLTDVAASTAIVAGRFSLINYSGTWSGALTYNSQPVADGDVIEIGPNKWIVELDSALPGANFASDYVSGSFFNLKAILRGTMFSVY